MARIFKPQQTQLPQPDWVTVKALSGNCDGVAHYKNKTVFVAGALPGETVLVKFTGKVKGNYKADIQSIRTASTHRVEPVCSYYERCGGCDFMHVAAKQQAILKQSLVLDSLRMNAHLVPTHIDAPITSQPSGYRSRTRLSLWRKNKRWVLGYRAKSSKEVVPVESCMVLSPRLERLLSPLQKWVATVNPNRALGHIELFEGDKSAGIMLRCSDQLSSAERSDLVQICEEFQVDLWLKIGQAAARFIDESRKPIYRYHLKQAEVSILFQVEDFTQINFQVNEAMVSRAIQWLAKVAQNGAFEEVLDLYCGIGNFTLALSTIAKKVTGIELFPEMVARATSNAGENGIKNAFFAGADLSDAKDVKALNFSEVDAALIDPPRAGAKDVIQLLAEQKVPWLLYVSCNPQTLVRDARILQGCGYQLERFCVLDMFPQTKHIESMGLFRLAE